MKIMKNFKDKIILVAIDHRRCIILYPELYVRQFVIHSYTFPVRLCLLQGCLLF